MKEIVDAIAPTVIRAGGHAGAAGVTVHKDNYLQMVDIMQATCQGYSAPDTDTLFYDMEIEAKDMQTMYEEVRRYAPYGEGNPAPIFVLKDIVLSPRGGTHYKLMGADSKHLKLFGNQFSAIGFDLAAKYIELGMPRMVNLIGTLSLNNFRNTKEYQIEICDIQAVKQKTARNLLSSVKTL